METERFVIINADDFGQSHGVNRGVLAAHQRGIVTSASLMVRWPAAEEAAVYARAHPEVSVGLHVDLGEWAYSRASWNWLPSYEVVPADDTEAVADEIERQIAAFRRLMGRDPTHLDSHQHVHRTGPARAVLEEVARPMGVPLRECTPAVAYRGDFYGQSAQGWPYPEAISVDALIALLAALRPGVTEVGCHPGLGGDLDTMYRFERDREVRALCDPRVRDAVADLGITLISFHDLPRPDRGTGLGASSCAS